MKMNYKHLGLYVLVGIVSALVTHMTMAELKDEMKLGFIFMTGIWLPVSILVVGDSVSGMRYRSDWFSPLILIIVCFVGGWSAFTVGYENYNLNWESRCTWFCNPMMILSGWIGGLFVGVGLALTWKVRPLGTLYRITMLAGLLGGLILSHDFSDGYWFLIWQPIVLLGIGIAVQIDSAKSSAEQ